MTIEEMKERKKELGLTNKMLSELSGVPIGTVQKIFGGETTSPRYKTIQALTEVLKKEENSYKETSYKKNYSQMDVFEVREEASYNYSRKKTGPKIGNKTYEDYMKLPEGARIEMIDGTFYDMAAPTTIHQDISGIIYFKFQEYIMKNRGNCKTYIAPTDVQLDRDEKTVVQPDIFVVCNRDQITKERVLGAPDLVVEVLSPSNFLMDLVIKYKKYKKAGVREYWVIVPEEKQVIVYRFDICDDPEIYTFDDKVPVGIWDGKCEIDFKEVYEQISFLY